MNADEKKKHWDKIFETKDTSQVSWYQPKPETAIRLIDSLCLCKSDKILEVGCGDSFVADHLLKNNYTDITVLDISEKALHTIKKRLAARKEHITFECCDVTSFKPAIKYKVWHDRAVFHFLTQKEDIIKYRQVATQCLAAGAYLIIGTFSIEGPDMCSALSVKQYSEQSLIDTFKNSFERVECFQEDHRTPSGSLQKFQYCVFKRLA